MSPLLWHAIYGVPSTLRPMYYAYVLLHTRSNRARLHWHMLILLMGSPPPLPVVVPSNPSEDVRPCADRGALTCEKEGIKI